MGIPPIEWWPSGHFNSPDRIASSRYLFFYRGVHPLSPRNKKKTLSEDEGVVVMLVDLKSGRTKNGLLRGFFWRTNDGVEVVDSETHETYIIATEHVIVSKWMSYAGVHVKWERDTIAQFPYEASLIDSLDQLLTCVEASPNSIICKENWLKPTQKRTKLNNY